MDDLLSGSDSQESLNHIYEGVRRVLESGCFPLHKIRTNYPQIFKNPTLMDSLDLSKQSNEEDSSRPLGPQDVYDNTQKAGEAGDEDPGPSRVPRSRRARAARAVVARPP
ncbi:hypothetical protein ACJJTC_000022 [Scirpophaga incertulas]